MPPAMKIGSIIEKVEKNIHNSEETEPYFFFTFSWNYFMALFFIRDSVILLDRFQ